MAIINLPSYDIAGITTPEAGLDLIHRNLSILRGIVRQTDFKKPEERASLCRNIAFVKQYYEKVDSLLIKEGR